RARARAEYEFRRSRNTWCREGSPSQGWKTFFRNHAQAIAAIDLCVVPTLSFERLFAFLVLGHGRSATAVARGDTVQSKISRRNESQILSVGTTFRLIRAAPFGTPYLNAPVTRSTELHTWQVGVLSARRRENSLFAHPKRVRS